MLEERVNSSMDNFSEFQRRQQLENGLAPDVMTPKMYAVILHNDDFTTMDFVVTLLVQVFRKTREEAASVMLAVHNRGEAVAGIYPLDIAKTKKMLAESMAAEGGFPLRVTVSEAETP